MLSTEALRREVDRLLSELREEHENTKSIFIDLGDDACKYHFMLQKFENMDKIRGQLRELVGDAATIAMIAKELGIDAASIERDTTNGPG